MRTNIIATTTNAIENAEIEKYIDLISTNVVIGTNFFSDFGASLTDLFGGFSDSYQNKLQKIYSTAIDNLKLKAVNMGANAILGLKIDFDEISGKGKSMFMISAIGTAVIIKFKNESIVSSNKNKVSVVSNELLEKEVTKRTILSNLKNEKFPSQDDWIYLFSNPIEEIAEKLLCLYLDRLSNADESPNVLLLLSNTMNYFKIIKNENAIDTLYSQISEKPQPILEIIKTNKLFSPSKIIELIQNDKAVLAIDCLDSDKEYYSNYDLELMQKIIHLLDNLPNKGRIEMVKGILGKSKEKYICLNGHSNDVENEYCQSINCYRNIKGFTHSEVNKIEKYKLKVNSLTSIFNE